MSYGEVEAYNLSGNKELGDLVIKYLKLKKNNLTVNCFADGELYARFEKPIRGKDVYIIQSLSKPVNEKIMELLITLDAAKRSDPSRLNVVLPYYAYARQDRQTLPHEPITARLLADLLTVAGANRIITIDLHSHQVQGFFNGPVEHLSALPIIAHYIGKKRITNLVIVAPDMGRVKMVKKYSEKLNAEFVSLHKSRAKKDNATCEILFGDVQNKNCVIIDDLISTGNTLLTAAKKLKECGAKSVIVAATHGVFSGKAFEKLSSNEIDEIIVTDTLPQHEAKKKLSKLKVLSVAGLLGESIKRLNKNMPLEELF